MKGRGDGKVDVFSAAPSPRRSWWGGWGQDLHPSRVYMHTHTHVCIPRSHREQVPDNLKKAKPMSNRLHCSSDSHLRRQDFQLIHLIHLPGSSPPCSAAGVRSCPEPSQPQGQPAAHRWLLQSLATTTASALSGLPGPHPSPGMAASPPRPLAPPALPFI